MSFFDQFSKVTKDFGNKAQEMTKDIKGKLEEQQAISRLNSQISEAKNQITDTYTAIGKRYYDAHKDDAEDEMQSQFQIIADAMEKIAQCKQQIKDIKNENTCPNCGAAISKEALFCPNCGTKIEKPQPEPEEEPQAKTCPVCGTPVDEDDVFCTNCGAPIKEETPSEESSEKTVSEQNGEEQPTEDIQ